MTFEFITQIVVAMIAGASSGYFAPWLAWKIEQARERNLSRRALVGKWREELLDLSKVQQEDVRIHGRPSAQSHAQFVVSHTLYSTLELHLSDEVRNELDRLVTENTIILDIGNSARPYTAAKLAKEIARIERGWGLV